MKNGLRGLRQLQQALHQVRCQLIDSLRNTLITKICLYNKPFYNSSEVMSPGLNVPMLLFQGK
jgi:hypothetical protein